MDITSQEIAQNYFSNRSEHTFNKYYKTFLPFSLRAIAKIFPKDKEKQDEISQKVFTKMWLTESYIFDNTKSHKSYIYLMSLNFAKIAINGSRYQKTKKVLKEEFKHDKESVNKAIEKNTVRTIEGVNVLNSLSFYREKQSFKNMHLHNFSEFKSFNNEDSNESELVENLLFQNNHEIFDQIQDETPDDEKQLYDIIAKHIQEMNRESNNDIINPDLLLRALSRTDNYNSLASEFGLNTEGAIKSRVFRVKSKIQKRIKEIQDGKDYLEGIKITGIIRLLYNEIDNEIDNDLINDVEYEDSNYSTKITAEVVEGILHGKYTRFHKNGNISIECFYQNGSKHGDYKKYNSNNVLVVNGRYFNNHKIGVWRTYHEDSSLNTVEEFDNLGTLDYFAVYDGIGSADSNITFNEICE